jgi:hypothetical protein
MILDASTITLIKERERGREREREREREVACGREGQENEGC